MYIFNHLTQSGTDNLQVAQVTAELSEVSITLFTNRLSCVGQKLSFSLQVDDLKMYSFNNTNLTRENEHLKK